MNGKKVAIGAAVFAAWITLTEVVGCIRRKQGFKRGYNSELSTDDIERLRELEKEEQKTLKIEA